MCYADGIKFSYEEAIKITESQEYKKIMLQIEDDYDNFLWEHPNINYTSLFHKARYEYTTNLMLMVINFI